MIYGTAAIMIGGAIWKQYSRSLNTKPQSKIIKKQQNELKELEKQRQNTRSAVDSVGIDSLELYIERELTSPNSYETKHINPPHND